MGKPKSLPIITASEVGEYGYCAKAWHLKRSGVVPEGEKLAEGTAYHRQHGEWTAQAAHWEGLARRVFGLAFLLLCLLALYWLLNGGTR